MAQKKEAGNLFKDFDDSKRAVVYLSPENTLNVIYHFSVYKNPLKWFLNDSLLSEEED